MLDDGAPEGPGVRDDDPDLHPEEDIGDLSGWAGRRRIVRAREGAMQAALELRPRVRTTGDQAERVRSADLGDELPVFVEHADEVAVEAVLELRQAPQEPPQPPEEERTGIADQDDERSG